MKVTVTEVSPVERTLEIAVERSRVSEAYDRALKRAARNLMVPGFRKGKVPLKIAARKIPRQSLQAQVLEELLPQAFGEALESHKIIPLSDPRWEIVEQDPDNDLVFKVSFEVRPQVEIRGYRHLEITQERPDITEEDVERQLEHLRLQETRLVPVEEERGLREGDVALVDFHSTDAEGRPLDRGSARNFPMEMEPGVFPEGFLEHLYGLKPGEVREFDFTFPVDYRGELAGRQVHWHFKLHEIKRKEVPDLDDEFARNVSDCDTLEALRLRIRENLEGQVQEWARNQAGQRLLERLAEQVPDDRVPPSLRTLKARIFAAEAVQRLRREGKDLEGFLQEQGKTLEDWHQYTDRMGHQEARLEIAVDSLAAQEGLEVSEEELEEQVRAHAREMGQPLSQVRARLEEEGTLAMLKLHLLRRKVTDFLLESARVEYVAPAQEVEAVYEGEEGASADQGPAETAASREAAEKET